MRSGKSFKCTLGIMACLVAVVPAANAFTVATFADPAVDGTTPLFSLNGNVLSGAWNGTGLLLQTPVLPAPDFPDATFIMSPLVATPINASLAMVGAGSIQFFDNLNQPILLIAFDSGLLTTAVSFGASDFIGQNVTFSGSLLGQPVTDEAFAFSFANPVAIPGGWTATAAFTSSAVPEPATLAFFLLGGLPLLRTRRR